MQLLLNITSEQNDQFTLLGARLLLSEQGKVYDPYSYGFGLSPEFSYTFAIRKEKIKRVKDCVQTKDMMEFSRNGEMFRASHSMELCRELCFTKILIGECNCITQANIINVKTTLTYPNCHSNVKLRGYLQ